MNDKKENTKVNEMTEQMHGQSAELTDDGLDSVSGGVTSIWNEKAAQRMREEHEKVMKKTEEMLNARR